MRNFGTINLIGSVIKFTLRHTPKGFPILDVTVGGNAPSRDGSKQIAFYQQVQVLGKYAETLNPLLATGTPVGVVGQLTQERWEKDGKKNSTVRITADSFVMLDGEHDTVADAKGQERLMNGMNRIGMLGNLTRDPELRYTPNGHAVCRFSVAVNTRRGEQEHVSFFDVQAWGALAETAAKLTKGTPVMLEGAIQNDNWTAQDGTKRYATRFEAFTLTPLRRPAGAAASSEDDKTANAAAQDNPPAEPALDEFPPEMDLPF